VFLTVFLPPIIGFHPPWLPHTLDYGSSNSYIKLARENEEKQVEQDLF